MIAWQRSALYEKDGSQENPPKDDLDQLLQFLQLEVERQEQRSLVKSGFEMTSSTINKTTKSKEARESNIPTAANLFNGQQVQVKSSICIFCEKMHESKDCAKVENWSIDDMKKKINEKQSCWKCLKPKHGKCRSFVKCHVCSQPHVTIMCPDLKKRKNSMMPLVTNTKSKQDQGYSGASLDINGDVLLKTVMAYVLAKENEQFLVRIMFDDGCQRSSITRRVTKAIRSIPVRTEIVRNVLFDGLKTDFQKTNVHSITLVSLCGSNVFHLVVRDEKIGGNISKIPKGF